MLPGCGQDSAAPQTGIAAIVDSQHFNAAEHDLLAIVEKRPPLNTSPSEDDPLRLRNTCRGIVATTLLAFIAVSLPGVNADDKPAKPPAADKPVPLNKSGTIQLEKANGKLLLKTEVVLREGVLEMLCCKKGTKEHESIVSFDGLARDVKVGLLAIGAKTGSPVSFDPKFAPPTGSRLEIVAVWSDEKGKEHREPAQRWARHVTRRYYVEKLPGGLPKGMTPIPEGSELRYDGKHEELLWFAKMSEAEKKTLLALSDDKAYRKAIESIFERSQTKPMQADFVFAGSHTYVDPMTKERFFTAEGGDLICVANFPSALVDVAERSTADGEGNLLYEAWTERVPPLGTKVTLEISVAKAEKAGDEKDE